MALCNLTTKEKSPLATVSSSCSRVDAKGDRRRGERRDQRREVGGERSGGRRTVRRKARSTARGGRRTVRWEANGQVEGDGDVDPWVGELRRRRFLGRWARRWNRRHWQYRWRYRWNRRARRLKFFWWGNRVSEGNRENRVREGKRESGKWNRKKRG